jgi:hypothetical protein
MAGKVCDRGCSLQGGQEVERVRQRGCKKIQPPKDTHTLGDLLPPRRPCFESFHHLSIMLLGFESISGLTIIRVFRI